MKFNEDFIQTIWKYQYFEKRELRTMADEPLTIKKIGTTNFHEGPDFKEAQIKLGDLELYGHVEVHLRSSDWYAHGHEKDMLYDSVVLHVVWEHDVEVRRKDGTLIPTLELKGRIYLEVLRNYQKLLDNGNKLLCSDSSREVKPIIRFSMLEKALVERLHEKAALIRQEIKDTEGDWEEVVYRWLFYCFGFKVNSQPMLKLARSLPYRVVKKHAGQALVQEALLLGQAGFDLESPVDDYSSFVKREYDFYHGKYQLIRNLYPSEWKFMRVRPSNYPSVRIAQLAAVLSKSPHLFSLLTTKVNAVNDLIAIFQVPPNPYWEHHYQLGKETKRPQNRLLSGGMISLLGINFVVPLWYAYGEYTDDGAWRERCFDFLQRISPEENSIISRFKGEGWEPENAYDTQGMIGLHNVYCVHKKCLDCKIGQNVLKPRPK